MLNMVKVLMVSNMILVFLVNFLELIKISVAFFHSFSFSVSHNQTLIFSNINLLILYDFVFNGISLTKFSLWSFKVIKQLLLPLISILSSISARFPYFVSSSFILRLYCLSFAGFSYMLHLLYYPGCDCIHLLLYYTYLRFCVMFDDCIVSKFLFNLLWKLLFTLRNLILCIISIMSSSNAIGSLTCGGHLLLLIPYFDQNLF